MSFLRKHVDATRFEPPEFRPKDFTRSRRQRGCEIPTSAQNETSWVHPARPLGCVVPSTEVLILVSSIYFSPPPTEIDPIESAKNSLFENAVGNARPFDAPVRPT